MLVSIVIPCYRQAHYLPEAIDSCLAQTHKELEIIVVNDGSDDNTEEVASGYGSRIRYIHRPNGGLSAARNTGIAIATGKYLKFLDADDYLAPDHIERQIELLSGSVSDIAVSTVRMFQDHDPTQFSDVVPEFDEFLPGFLRLPNSAIHAYLFPSQLVRRIGGFNERLRIAEDWDMFCRLGKRRVRLIRDLHIGAFYRLRQGSMSQNRPAMVTGVAHQLIKLHSEFREGEYREWFGCDLLSAEQRTYRRLLLLEERRHDLEQELLACILELRGYVRGNSLGWKFGLIQRCVGYATAEQFYARYVRAKVSWTNRTK